ncbi:ABC-F family ATP-binding cassette domain-containing protein [uncultured Veillonella sp.]|uniref:ABC-F family ATP-binding cassette domain-containing protein n=1 Tax=uncultured Veillonella sp. TaxID=159268 RepID=UPI002587C40C|nr:ABC-F family ATP-binding cassette domain-containing protein [uncultured Veillonella sp.]
MERIRIIGLGKSFGIREIFKDISFEIKTGDRLGLVGPNGAGKSTLLKCIMGLEEPDVGQVVIDDAASIGYLQQDISLGNDSLEEEIQKAWRDVQHLEEQLQEVTTRLEQQPDNERDLQRLAHLQERLEWLGGYDYEAQSRRIAYGLGFTDEDLKKPADEFSGGQKTRINLAKALVRRPEFLFLDEPTNHLDMDMLEWLEGYLSAYRGGILIVSHDRYFLDRVATGIVELDHHKATVYKGNYSRYLQLRYERMKAARTAYEKQQEYIRKTEEYIDKYRAGIKSKMARGRQSQLNRLERLEAPEISKHLRFTFPPAAVSADKVLVVEEVSVGYGNRDIIDDVSFTVRRGEAVGLIGPNGAGKSTLVKAIMGELVPEIGFIDIGNRVQIGYFSQEHEELHDHWTVLEEIMNNFNYSEEKARNVLGMFLYRGDDVFKMVGDLSGGERARLALLKLFLEGDNFLVLDEPTNHLDIPTREVVEEALQRFEGTCFVISHDRYFLDKVAKRILVLDEGKITEYGGNFSYYKEKLHEQAERERLANEESEAGKRHHSANGGATTADNAAGVKGAQTKSSVDTGSAEATPTGEVKKPNAYMQAKRLTEIETEIARLEATLKMYEVQVANPEVQSDPEEMAQVANEMEEVTTKLETLYEQWEALAE